MNRFSGYLCLLVQIFVFRAACDLPMAADRYDRVALITGTLSVEALPSNAAQ